MTAVNWPQYKNLRSFPKGKRNCYTLKPKEGKNVNYLITAFFMYGNYDGKNDPPQFDLYIGVNRWRTINLNTQTIAFYDVVYLATTDIVDVCLVNINSGTPFISALQLRPLLNSSLYETGPGNLLALVHRYDCGVPNSTEKYKYQDDVYDRIWENDFPIGSNMKTVAASRLDFGKGYSEQPAATVLKTLIQPQTSTWMRYNFEYSDIAEPSSEFFVLLHFAEIVQSSQGQRHFTVNINGNIQGPITPQYMKPTPIYSPKDSVKGNVRLFIEATTDSQLPPILNALEIFILIPLQESPSDPVDVNAMMEIKRTYGVTDDSWQGDPCIPKDFSWSRLGCNTDKSPMITSLNLSSSGLTGEIIASFSNLKYLHVLDLSYNNLTGSIPESLAELASLEVLNLAGNKLEGSVPKALLEMSEREALKLSLNENPKLCFSNACKHKKNKAIIFGLVAVAILVVAMVILLVCFSKWISRIGGAVIRGFNKKWSYQPRIQRFRYADLMTITNNLDPDSLIGQGGFGKVYFGKLKGKDGTYKDVAVKLRSKTSTQGAEQFENEVNNLVDVHHKNLVSLIGYCNEGDKMAVIYEYMANGNLKQHISPDESNIPLTWKKRLQIAIDAAQGLKYLHEDCNPSIVHGDLKTTNILLSKKLEAKIADFGLSKTFFTESTTDPNAKTTTIPIDSKGIIGYLDPQFSESKELNKKSDVYSFGVMLLELITGLEARTKAGNTYKHISEVVTPRFDQQNFESIVDPRLPKGTYKIQSASKAIEAAMTCMNSDAGKRQDMKWVLRELEDALKIEIGSEGTQSTNLMDNNSNASDPLMNLESERPSTQ